MKKNLYYRTVVRRQNNTTRAILNFFLNICSYPRLILEVFIRKNFGERYFSIDSSIVAAVLLIVYPVVITNMDIFPRTISRYRHRDENSFWADYTTWYLFVAVFLYFCFLRWKEVKRNPSVYDFARYSLSCGEINPIFFKIKINGKTFSFREIETFLEPLLFFIIGLLLIFLSQKIGVVILIASILYGLSYTAAYKNGDDFALDKIDELIMNEEMARSFSGEEEISPKGVRFFMKKPNREDLRKRLADSFIEDDDRDSEKTYAE